METLTAWWNSFTPASRVLVWDLAIVTIALFLGAVVGGWARARLKAFGIDELLPLPWSVPKREIEEKPGAGDLFSYLVDASFWIVGAVVIANQHQNKAMADLFLSALSKAWILGILAFLATFLARAVSQAASDLLKHPAIREPLETAFPAQKESASGPLVEVLARAAGTLVFAFLFLLLFITLAELLGLNGLAASTVALWNLGLKLVSVVAALLIGGMGVFAAGRALPSTGKEATQEDRIQGFTRIGIVAVTTVLAVDLVTSAASTFTWLAALFLLAVFLEPLRGSLLDIWAGFTLEFYGVKTVRMGETEMAVEKPGFLNTVLRTSSGEILQRQNREVLAAHFNANAPQRPSSVPSLPQHPPSV